MKSNFQLLKYSAAVFSCLAFQSFYSLGYNYLKSNVSPAEEDTLNVSSFTEPCSPLSSFMCPAIVKSLPVRLTFSANQGGLTDKNGAKMGFTMVDRPFAPLITPTFSNVPGYEPSKLEVNAGKLIITTTSGISYLKPATSPKTNSQVNALGIGFVSPSKFIVQTTLVQPNAGTGNSEQAGLWFGLDEDNFVKLVALSAAGGKSKVEMRKEVAAQSSAIDVKSSGVLTLSSSLVKLRFLIDKSTNTIQGFYSINGTTEVSVGVLNVPQSFIAGKTLSDGVTQNISFAGIFATHRSASAPLKYSFEDFKVESASPRPSVVSVNPANNATNVSVNTSISTDILTLPNGGINNATITSSCVFLTENLTGMVVPSHVNGTGGGDAITLVPASPLQPNTTYKFNITGGVQDLSGTSFSPYTSMFTTKPPVTAPKIPASFSRVELPNAGGRHSSLQIGPDGKLYALTIDGIIKRFSINPDGTLGNPDSLNSLQTACGSQRFAIGFAFDPTATATNLIAWITHSSFVFLEAPDWDGKLTKLSGNNLETVQDVVISLPRSVKDHLTNSIAFGPDGALYIAQGSNSAMGKGDTTWGLREENLLSGAILRLDRSKLGGLPLDVKTAEGGGSYNPYLPTSPLTIYASGVRNAYDLLWHSNGQLYVPTNGSAAGGNTPHSVPGTLRPNGTTYNSAPIAALDKVQQTQKDFLFRVVKGGYYGHPNALRGEYVLNGGNPTAAFDSAQVDAYPVGTMPDANWRKYSFDFQNNKSPNGVIEYKSNIFGDSLKGKILIVRYSQNDDIISLTPGGANKDIIYSVEGASIPGFTGFIDPLDLVENVSNGNIYVSEYGGEGKIVLLKPVTSLNAPALLTSKPEAVAYANSEAPGVSSSSRQVADQSYTNNSNNRIMAVYKNSSAINIPSCDDPSGVLVTAVKPKDSVTVLVDSVQTIVRTESNIKPPKVYPNPVEKAFNIYFPDTYAGDVLLQIADPVGKVYETGRLSLNPGGTRTFGVNISNLFLRSGIYFLRVNYNKRKADVIKLMVK